MLADLKKATSLLREFKGESYLFGRGVLATIGPRAGRAGARAALVHGTFAGSDAHVGAICDSLAEAQVELAAQIRGVRPNAPLEDVMRVTEELRQADATVLISFGGGSTIDAAKAAEVLRALGGDVEEYFGTGCVTEMLRSRHRTLAPHVAMQSVASSAAHLTKYANITDLTTGQKRLIVDDAIVPSHPVFDYQVTQSVPAELTTDGALDGVSHMLEVLYGAAGKAHYEKAAEIAATGLALVMEYLPRALADSGDAEARDGLCLATDLGGYAIMIGGTNGGHLTSFSLVDILPHGRACAIMNPYYTVLFAPAIEEALRLVGRVLEEAGLATAGIGSLRGRELGVAVAEALFTFAGRIGFPTRLADIPGFGPAHIERALAAAKNPQLKMKLQNMPVPLTAEMVDDYMGPVLEAAWHGDVQGIRNVP